MEVNSSLIEKLSTLSRLQFNEMEKEEIRLDLQRMIHFVEKLNELNLVGVKPLLHIPEENNVLREDVVKGELTREMALKNAPEQNGEFFLVPKVIQKG
jgi:aspartyl-tRNA(Asn)/glutamyl-tRNA(Gln) amidotransferase subunit C